MSGPLRIALAAALLALPAACSLLVDTSDLAGELEQPDAGREASSVGDALPAPDALVLDGGVDAADAQPCVDGPTRFCDDFDHAGSKWVDYLRRGQVSADGGGGLSLPNALRAAVVSGTGAGTAAVGKDFDGRPTHLRCELDAKLETIPTSGEVDLLDFFTILPGAENHHFYFGAFDGTWSVGEFRVGSDAGVLIDRVKALGAPLPANVWLHVVFDLSPSALTVTANGHAMTLADLTVPPASARRRLSVGVTYASDNIPSAATSIDNVDCTLGP